MERNPTKRSPRGAISPAKAEDRSRQKEKEMGEEKNAEQYKAGRQAQGR